MTIPAVIASGVVTTRYVVGQEAALATTVTVAGVAADPDDITLTIVPVTAAAPTVTVPKGTLQHPATGQYGYVYTIPAPGHYQWTWTTAGVGKGVHSGWFDAVPATPPLVTLVDARDAINRTSRPMSERDTAELQLFTDAVNGWITERCGPVVPQTLTVAASVRRGQLVVPDDPHIVRVVSATSSGLPLDTALWAVAGRGRIGLPVGAVWSGAADVTIVAGWSPVPPDLILGARLLLQHMWTTQRAQSAAPATGGDDLVVAGVGYAIPNRVATLVAPYEKPDGLA